MSSRLGLLAVSLAFAVASACGAGIAVLGGAASCGLPAATAALRDPPAVRTVHADWDTAQLGNAATIVAVGADFDVPDRGWVIAVATAMQESTLTDTPGGDRDSVGLFQQRPSQGWGTPQQLLDPVYAAGQFYDRLLAIPGWQRMPLSDAAQAVQHSSTPHAYAKWESDATTLVAAVGSSANRAMSVDLEHCPSNCPAILSSQGPGRTPAAVLCDGGGVLFAPPDGFTLPSGTPVQVATAVGWALQQLGTPYSYGGDCTAAHSGESAHQCDCSSLVQQAYHAAGISLPRTAAEQSRVGALVLGPDRLRPGDLLFVPGSDGTVADPGHVGMYLGDGLVVSAPQTGQVVRLSPLAPYWLTESVFRRVVGG
jgi:hypothetical protein